MIFPGKYPLIQAPLAGAADANMAIAVCRAGAVGSLAAAMWSADKLAEEIEKINTQVPNAIFNVNFFAHQMPNITNEQENAWQNLLNKYFQEFNLDPNNIPQPALRLPFNEQHLSVIEKYRPAIVSFHFGLPDRNLLNAVKQTGALVLSTATTVEEGLFLQENGADMIIAQGIEAGGHRGMFLNQKLEEQVGTFALVSTLSDKLKKPIIAAGGIAGSKEIRAALALGAQAVQIGTSYLLCHESLISNIHRQAIENMQKTPQKYASSITNLFSGKPARGIKNRFMCENNCLSQDVLPFPFAASKINALKKAAEDQGLSDFSSLWCGQNPSACKNISAFDLTLEFLKAFDC